jgi:hypothetical protein
MSIKDAYKPGALVITTLSKKKMHFYSYKRKVIPISTKTRLKEVWAPFHLKNIFIQNRSIKYTKPSTLNTTQIWNHQSPTL